MATMKSRVFHYLASALLIIGLPDAAQQPTIKRNAVQAADKVWVIVNSVKADQRAQVRRFVNDSFWPGAAKLSSA